MCKPASLGDDFGPTVSSLQAHKEGAVPGLPGWSQLVLQVHLCRLRLFCFDSFDLKMAQLGENCVLLADGDVGVGDVTWIFCPGWLLIRL